ANAVENYWRRRTGLTDRQRRQVADLSREMSRLMQQLSVADRLAVGRFIGLHKKMSFDVGLRIGIQAFACRHNRREEGFEDVSQGEVLRRVMAKAQPEG